MIKKILCWLGFYKIKYKGYRILCLNPKEIKKRIKQGDERMIKTLNEAIKKFEELK